VSQHVLPEVVELLVCGQQALRFIRDTGGSTDDEATVDIIGILGACGQRIDELPRAVADEDDRQAVAEVENQLVAGGTFKVEILPGETPTVKHVVTDAWVSLLRAFVAHIDAGTLPASVPHSTIDAIRDIVTKWDGPTRDNG
jgi:hypothetical protein